MKRRQNGFWFLVVLLLGVDVLMGACARTSIERGPMGFAYVSDKDIAIEGLEYTRTAPDGSTEHLTISRAGGSASTVEAARWGAFNELVKRIPITP